MEAIICDVCDKRVDVTGKERWEEFGYYELKMRGPKGYSMTNPLSSGTRHFCCVEHLREWLTCQYPTSDEGEWK